MATQKSTEEISKAFRQMSVGSDDINVLLLGETGIGKSTFINSFTNYLHYKTFSVAEKNEVKCLVPTKFELTIEVNGKYEKKTISMGEDTNENTNITSAATQYPRSYVFPLPNHNNRNFRLIDTPGICDDRGIDKDKENLENILTYIANIEQLHAICILLKPNNARLTVAFEYCITQLLSRLEKSAGENIVFIFTNSRSTFYAPGDSKVALEKILDTIAKNPPHVKIQFEKENVFCLDNEAFRYLAALKQNHNLANKNSFSHSWDKSVEECSRLIKYIIGEGPKKIVPHQVSKTISVNKARQTILELSKPLADITDHINDNLHVLQKHKKTLQTDYSSIETLKTQLYVPIVNLEQIECNQPVTVCVNTKCCETIAVGDLQKQHYKQRCHNPCYLTNVTKEIVGDKALTNCAAMNRRGQCNECGCDFSAHMHIYYETRTVNGKMEGAGVKAQIVDRETAIKATQDIIRKIEKDKNQYENEKTTIVKTMAKFAHFLEQNAISPFNDSYKSYIQYLIDRENGRGPNRCVQTVQSLESLLKQYDEERKILQDAMKYRLGSAPKDITPDVILKEIKDLYALPKTGVIIKNLHKMQKRGEASEHKETEFVLPHSPSNFNDHFTRSNRDRGKNKGQAGPKPNPNNYKVNDNNQFKNNKKGGPRQEKLRNMGRTYQQQNKQTESWRDKGPNPNFQQNPPYQNVPNNLGNFNKNIPSLLNLQIPPQVYYQRNPMNYQNPNFNAGFNNQPQHPMHYQNIPNQPNQYPGSFWNPNQPHQGYMPPYMQQNYNPPQNNNPPPYSPSPNNTTNFKEYNNANASQYNNAQPPKYNNANPSQYNTKNYNFDDSSFNSDHYKELYGDKDTHKSTQKVAKNTYSKDSDSDNENNLEFDKFRKRKGLDKQKCNYEELYGDHDDDNDDDNYGKPAQKSSGIFSTMRNLFH